MSFLLDTDICSAHIKQRGGLTHRFVQYSGRLHVSVITVGELYTWAIRKQSSAKRAQAVSDLLQSVTILDVTSAIGQKFGELRADALDRGYAPADMDFLIAATALVHGLTLVTHNIQDFASITNLHVVDWLAS